MVFFRKNFFSESPVVATFLWNQSQTVLCLKAIFPPCFCRFLVRNQKYFRNAKIRKTDEEKEYFEEQNDSIFWRGISTKMGRCKISGSGLPNNLKLLSLAVLFAYFSNSHQIRYQKYVSIRLLLCNTYGLFLFELPTGNWFCVASVHEEQIKLFVTFALTIFLKLHFVGFLIFLSDRKLFGQTAPCSHKFSLEWIDRIFHPIFSSVNFWFQWMSRSGNKDENSLMCKG